MHLRTLFCIVCVTLLSATAIHAADNAATDSDGVVTWHPSEAASHIDGKFKPTRWGMYDVEAQLAHAEAGRINLKLADKQLSATADGSSDHVKLGRTYINTEDERAVAITTEPTDAKKSLVVSALIFTPAPEGQPIVQAGDLSITLHAHDATVHGVTLRYEFRPDKNTLGYWSNPKDWVSWDFEVKKPGKFNVVVMQGSPGSKEIQIAVGDQTLNYTTKNTGSFHTFAFVEVGTLTFDSPGMNRLTLKPKSDVRGSVMDLRQVFLLPILK